MPCRPAAAAGSTPAPSDREPSSKQCGLRTSHVWHLEFAKLSLDLGVSFDLDRIGRINLRMLQTLALKPSPAPNTRSPSEGPRRFHQGSWPGYQMRQTLCGTATIMRISGPQTGSAFGNFVLHLFCIFLHLLFACFYVLHFFCICCLHFVLRLLPCLNLALHFFCIFVG